MCSVAYQTSVGIVTAPAVFPIACTLLWKKQNTVAVVMAPLLGTATGLACWIGSTHHWYSTVRHKIFHYRREGLRCIT